MEKNTIEKNDVIAAKSLLKLNKYQETAREIITEVITNSKYHANPTTPEVDRLYYKELQELAFEALGEICNSDELDSEGADDFCCTGGVCTG